MNTLNKKFILFLGILFLPIVSCTDQLELEPISSISESTYWKTENDATGVLYGMYDLLRALAEDNSLLYWGDGRSEVMGLSFGAAGINLYFDNLLSANDAGAGWQGLYAVIHHANLLIKYAPEIEFSNEQDKNRILAEAYTMRAFVYYWLVRLWGDTIIVTEPTEDFSPSAIQKERSSESEVFELIKSDLQRALELFPNNSIPEGRFNWSKPAMQTLKADVFLWTAKVMGGGTEDLTVALNALEDAEDADAELLDDYESVFNYDNKGNNEVLFSLRFGQFESEANWGFFSYMSPTFFSSDFDQETIDAIGVMGIGGSLFTISDVVREQFSEDDQRKDATYIDMYTINEMDEREYYGTFCRKYDGTVNGGTRLFVDDIVIYRYADILLLKAEVKNALGQDPEFEVNEIRRRAYGDQYGDHVFVSGSPEENNAAILQERLLEFSMEGKRWFDLIRNDKVFELVPSLQDRAGQDYLLLFPISQQILSLEPKIEQNPGY